MLELKLLWRDWKGAQLSLIAASLVLAVAVVAGVAILAERVQGGLSREASGFIASDLIIHSSIEVPRLYWDKADELGLQTAESTQFSSMIFRDDHTHLGTVKAVGDLYPLRGELTITDVPFAPDDSTWSKTNQGPSAGEAWVEERLLPIMDMEMGDSIEVGNLELPVTKVIISEPDRGSGFSVMGARVMINAQDLPATGVVQPGSRVSYHMLVAGEDTQVQSFQDWLDEMVNEDYNEHLHYHLPEESEERLQSALERGRSFLLLAGTVGVLLAAIALALSSQRYAERHKDSIALMKSWGLSASRIRSILFRQIALLGLFCTVIGLLLGVGIHQFLLWSISDLLPGGLPQAGIGPYLVASMTGVFCLMGFALPAMWHLPSIEPLRVLRRDLPTSALSLGERALAGIAMLIGILFFYSSSLLMTFSFIGGAAVVALVLGGLAYGLMTLFKRWATRAGSIFRLSIGNLWRRKWQSIIQMIAFSFTIMFLLVMLSMRTSLLEDWQLQLPEDAPNHFLVNVAPYEVDHVQDMLADHQLQSAEWYPMVRGRLIKQNGEMILEERLDLADGLDREVNLTWAMQLPDSNEVVAGEWWTEPGKAEFSMEEEVAGQLGVELGDMFTFSLGGLEVEAELTSLRSVDWDSMKPNFFIIFPEGVLEDYSPNWITSVYLEREDKLFINDLLSEYPTILVVALDEIINRIRIVIDRVSMGLEMMLMLVLACGILVLFAAIATSFDERAQESAILRTLGSSRKIVLGALFLEFGFMGFMAGLVGALGAQIAVFALQYFVFNMDLVFYGWIWLVGPLSGAIVVSAMGLMRSYSLVTTPPLQSLRALG